MYWDICFGPFDVASSGWNDENMIASIANRNGAQESNREDILSRKKQYAAESLGSIWLSPDMTALYCGVGNGKCMLL
jgi:hypothetical protein